MDDLIIYEKNRFYISNKLDIVRCTKSDGGLVNFEYTDSKSTLGFYKNSTDLRKQLPVELTIGVNQENIYNNFQFITESLDIVLSQSSDFSKKEDHILREEPIFVGLDAENSKYIAKTIKDKKEIVLILNIRSKLIEKLVNKKKQLIKTLQR
jgi:ElaB/YqjD/DUF883 family membrane-anchored ribosome-binding protein